jgi:HCOMODA/2-hydroxy-3-carboxy-muconic semialdehyde decarboxylase
VTVDPAGLAADVALVARILARLGFVHAFGHVSARAVDNLGPPVPGSATLPHRGTSQRGGGFRRAEGGLAPGARGLAPGARGLAPGARGVERGEGGRVLLTPTFPPLGEQRGGDVLELELDGRTVGGSAEHRPLEAPLHLAVYAAQPGVGAICRLHAPAVAAYAAIGTVPPLLHGFGGMVEPVVFWDDPDLVADDADAGRVAAALGEAPAVLLAGNGGLAVGADLDQALARAWCLEDRCRVALAAGDRARPLAPEAIDRRRRWYDAETVRLARWLRSTGAP